MEETEQAKEETTSELKDPTMEKIGNIATAMGCGPSQAVIIQPQTNYGNPDLHPTIFMVAEESFQLLRELGELKFYHLAQHGEAQEIENQHREIANRLENPVASIENESRQSEQSENEQSEEIKVEIVSRVCTVKGSTTSVRSHSSHVNSAGTSATEGAVVVRQGLTSSTPLRNECLADILENPLQVKTSAVDLIDITSTSASSLPKLERTARPKPKAAKTFFGRNRVKPKQRTGNNNRYLQPLNIEELGATAQGPKETKLQGEDTVRGIPTEESITAPDPSNDSSRNLDTS